MFIFGAANKEELDAIEAMGHEVLRVASADDVDKLGLFLLRRPTRRCVDPVGAKSPSINACESAMN